MSLAVESSKPLSLVEAHFKAIGKPLQRPLVQPSKTSKKKQPKKGFRLAKKRAKGGFARDKEVIAKAKKVKGVAKELPSDLETVSLQRRRTKREQETEQALQIVRDDPRRPVGETTSILREQQINKKIDDLDKGFDDKLGSVFEALQSEIRFGSEPADVGAGKRRRRKKGRRLQVEELPSRITTAEQFFEERTIHKYRDEQALLQDYPENISILTALRDERVLDRGLFNEIEAGIRQYNREQSIVEDIALEQTGTAQFKILREKAKGGGRYTGGGSGGFSTLSSTASSVDSSLAEKLRRASEERVAVDRQRDEDFEGADAISRLKGGRRVFSGADTGFLSQRQSQKEAGLLAHSSESSTSSGDAVRRDRGLRTITDEEDRLSSGSLRFDGTSTSERESVASELDRHSQDEWAQQSGGRVAGHFQKFETRAPITRAPQPEPEPKTQPSKKQTKAIKSSKEIGQEISANEREQRSLNAQLSEIRRTRGRSGGGSGKREQQLSEEAPILARISVLEQEEVKLQSQQLEAYSRQSASRKTERQEGNRSSARTQEQSGTNSTADAIRIGSEVGTSATGGNTPYGVKPRSKQQAKTLLTELAEDSRERAVESSEMEQAFSNLDTFTQTAEPKLDLSPITPRSAKEETTPRGRGETPTPSPRTSPEQEGGGVGGVLLGGAKAIGGGALGVAQGVGGAIQEQLPAPQDVARGIARAGTGVVLGAVQGVAEGVSGALGGGGTEAEPTDV